MRVWLLALLLLFGSAQAPARPHGGNASVSAPTSIMRGVGQNMRFAVQGFIGGSNIAQTTRVRTYAETTFQCFQIPLQVFYVNGTPQVDTLFTNAYNMQAALEYPWTNATTGLSPSNRVMPTWTGAGGSTYVSYNPASPPAAGFEDSDLTCMPSTVLAGTYYGVWTTIECTGTCGTNVIPYQANGSNFINRFMGCTQSASSQISANYLATTTSIGAVSTSLNGASCDFTAPFVQIQVASTSSDKFVLGIDDSIGYGVVSANTPTAAITFTASPVCASAPCTLALTSNWTYPSGAYSVHFSDGENVQVGLAALSTVATVQTVITGAPTTAATAYESCGGGPCGDPMGDVQSNAGIDAPYVIEGKGHNYINLSKGGDSLNYITGTNAAEYRLQLIAAANPTNVLIGLGHNDLSAGRTPAQMASNFLTLESEINGALGHSVPYTVRAVTPDTSAGSTDMYETIAGQTVSTNWGTSSSNRGVWNDTYVRAYGSSLGAACYIDPDPAIESGYNEGVTASETSIYNIFPQFTYGYTIDGTHPSFPGYFYANQQMYANCGGTTVADPFTGAAVTAQISSIQPLTSASVGVAYSNTLTATGGTGPYTWTAASFSPNTNSQFSFSTGGAITGTPSTAETEFMNVCVVDSASHSACRLLTLPVFAGGSSVTNQSSQNVINLSSQQVIN